MQFQPAKAGVRGGGIRHRVYGVLTMKRILISTIAILALTGPAFAAGHSHGGVAGVGVSTSTGGFAAGFGKANASYSGMAAAGAIGIGSTAATGAVAASSASGSVHGVGLAASGDSSSAQGVAGAAK